jgi:hypothetical protein
MPKNELTASQASLATSTPVNQTSATAHAPAPSATKIVVSVTPSLAPAPGPVQGEHKIITYDKNSAGGRRIVVYVESARDTESIVNQNKTAEIGVTITATPPRSIRVINYAKDN